MGADTVLESEPKTRTGRTKGSATRDGGGGPRQEHTAESCGRRTPALRRLPVESTCTPGHRPKDTPATDWELEERGRPSVPRSCTPLLETSIWVDYVSYSRP